jgi:hypothetical protein
LPESTKENHNKTADQDSSFEVTKFREFREPNKTDSLTTKGKLIKSRLMWFIKQRAGFKTAQLNTAQTDMALSKKFPNLK